MSCKNNTRESVNLFYQPLIPDNVHYLDSSESKHATRVLRLKAGDAIVITDGLGTRYRARITKADVQQCSFAIEEQIREPARNFFIHVAIAPTKNPDRIEWFVEKAVELGIDGITLITCEHSERSRINTERLHNIAVSAMKQSLTLTLPVISGPLPVTEVIHHHKETSKFIAHVDALNPDHLQDMAAPGSSYLVLIGPEGDFSNNELAAAADHHFSKVSLGTRRLRTETAGLAACHILNLINTK
jgi:16S rRNA (uracil1498-N3)-methyltransferase